MVIGRLHVRLYYNPEFALMRTEQIEQVEHVLNELHPRTPADWALQRTVRASCTRLKQAYDQLSSTQKEEERKERARREAIRADRLTEFHTFRDETYRLLATSCQADYRVGVQNTTAQNTTITETITLPRIPERTAYPATLVYLTSEQV